MGKTENNGVYIGEKGTLIARFEAPDADRVKKNRAALEALVQKAGVPVYLALIPGAVEVWSDRLPAGAPNASQAELIADICAGTAARTVDVLGALSAHQQEDIYYRTDHHWTTLGAYYGYAALIRALGGEPAPAESFDRQVVSDAFYGTNYAKAGARWIRPDAIERWVAGDGATVLLDGTAPAALYAPDKLETRDKYAYFLGGNRGLSVVRTGHEGGKLLLLRDSYSDSEAPFLLALRRDPPDRPAVLQRQYPGIYRTAGDRRRRGEHERGHFYRRALDGADRLLKTQAGRAPLRASGTEGAA